MIKEKITMTFFYCFTQYRCTALLKNTKNSKIQRILSLNLKAKEEEEEKWKNKKQKELRQMKCKKKNSRQTRCLDLSLLS